MSAALLAARIVLPIALKALSEFHRQATRRPHVPLSGRYRAWVEVEGVDRLLAKFEMMEKHAAKQNANVAVQYSAPYAIYVHEDLDAQHDDGEQAKYLEGPARKYRREIANVITQVYKREKDMTKAITAGAEFLLQVSQDVVPVDTGYLRNSGRVVINGREQPSNMWTPRTSKPKSTFRPKKYPKK